MLAAVLLACTCASPAPDPTREELGGGAVTVNDGPPPEDPAYWLAIDQLRAEDYAAAEATYLDLTQRLPTEHHAYIGLGGARSLQGDDQGAWEAYQQALALEPNSISAFIGMGSVRMDQDNPEAARALYDEALERDPESADVHLGLYNACIALQDEACWRTHGGRFIALAPDSQYAPAVALSLGVKL